MRQTDGQNRGKSLGSNFKSISRDKYFATHVKSKTTVPPVGYYRTSHKALDSHLQVPMYGTYDKWGGVNAKKALKIKEREFQRTHSKPCARIGRAMVFMRNQTLASPHGSGSLAGRKFSTMSKGFNQGSMTQVKTNPHLTVDNAELDHGTSIDSIMSQQDSRGADYS